VRVENFLRLSAQRLPRKPAVIAGKRRLSYTELDVMSDRLAAALLDRGIGRGDAIVLFMENSFEAVVATFAVVKAGAAFCPVSPFTQGETLAFVLNGSRSAAIITQARLASIAGMAVARTESVKLVVLAGAGGVPAAAGCLSFEEAVATTADAPARPGDACDPAMIIHPAGANRFATGTTVTHEDVAAGIARVATFVAGDEDDLVHVEAPFSTEDRLRHVLSALAAGATLMLDASGGGADACRTRSQTILDRDAEADLALESAWSRAGNGRDPRQGHELPPHRSGRAGGHLWRG
jgi:acyl-CoA synthetase (AMP-forming)/AMP-acid ligase II